VQSEPRFTKEKSLDCERLSRVVFWTFFVLTIGLSSYGFLVESFGIGLFLHHFPVPKFHMRAEAEIARMLSLLPAIGLFAASILVRRWNRTLLGVGLTGCAYWFGYWALPRI
jgi:hypothetical protein